MDYLYPQFHDYLNQEGGVSIAQVNFSRDRILRELEATEYEVAFQEWLDIRKTENLSRADEILEKFDNLSRFNRLKEIFKRDSVIPFVGAGLSMPCGYPGWTKFLYSVLDETTADRIVFGSMINTGQYEEAAQLLKEALPNGSFLEQVENKFGLDPSELNGVVQRLPFLFKSAVITTNFDNVLKKCYMNADQAFDEELLGADADELPRLLGEGKKVLVKLHGKANVSRKRVLTKEEYDAHYGEEGKLEAVIEAISTKSLLFIGCSLSVDRTLKCLKSICNRKGPENQPRHYAFLKLAHGEDRVTRKNQLNESNIYPIWYEGDHDECLEALFEKLAE